MPNTPHLALINNLGGALFLEMSILTETLLASDLGQNIRHVIGPDAMMTALDMHGFSISLMELSNGDEQLLAQAVGAPAWPGCNKAQTPVVLALPDGLSPIRAPRKTKPFKLASTGR